MSAKLGIVTIAGKQYNVIMTSGIDSFKHWFTPFTINAYKIQGVYLKLYFNKITTKDMDFSIDIIFLDKNHNVLKREYSVKPEMSVKAPKHAKYALELLPDISI